MKISKNYITNGICLTVGWIGYVEFFPSISPALYFGGLFGFSGAITNSLAIYMLFEKVPFLYGSGVVPNKFESFKYHIKLILMDNIFTEENLKRHVELLMSSLKPSEEEILEKINLDLIFDDIVNVVMDSKFGAMLGMFGGKSSLEGLREEFKNKFGLKIADMVSSVINQPESLSPEKGEKIKRTIEAMIDTKLNELNPSDVKKIVERIIREHLDWLVVWGGVLGFLIGFVTSLII